jgi:hypothetical protein
MFELFQGGILASVSKLNGLDIVKLDVSHSETGCIEGMRLT